MAQQEAVSPCPLNSSWPCGLRLQGLSYRGPSLCKLPSVLLVEPMTLWTSMWTSWVQQDSLAQGSQHWLPFPGASSGRQLESPLLPAALGPCKSQHAVNQDEGERGAWVA